MQMEMKQMINFSINNLKNKKLKNVISKSILKTCKALNIKNIMLSITFIGDRSIRKMNKIYLKKDKTTDVLSFLLDDENGIGDIYISQETAKKNAVKLGHSMEEELSFLTIHSILHLAGYDHKKLLERKRMENKEEQIFNSIWLN